MRETAQGTRRKRAIVFCHGVRERTLAESGGRHALASIFDYIIDTSSFMKPWEAVQPYTDWVRGEAALCLQDSRKFSGFLNYERMAYVLFVGLERSQERFEVIRAVQESGAEWGALFNRGDLRDLFEGRQYDSARARHVGFRDRLSNLRKRWSTRGLVARHLFTHETTCSDFSEFPGAREVVPVNHRDHDALKACMGDRRKAQSGIVFIDQALPHVYRDGVENSKFARHYDSQRAQRYYAAVVDYLNAMSQIHGLPVTVCLHPNSPSDQDNPFRGHFETTKFETVSAVSSAEIVVTHMSSTTGLCHVLKKPTVLLALSDDLMPQKAHSHIERKARNEQLVIHRWPSDAAGLPTPSPAQSARIADFVAPVPDAPLLETTLASTLNALR